MPTKSAQAQAYEAFRAASMAASESGYLDPAAVAAEKAAMQAFLATMSAEELSAYLAKSRAEYRSLVRKRR